VKALLDQNLSFRLLDVLLPRFPGSLHVRDVALTGDDDERIWVLARTEGFVIVTKDNDFLARALVRGHPPQVIQICLGNASTGQIAKLLTARMDEIERFVSENRESVFLLRE
jgi:predicted nuclease of predicted toxin-antitoxin system